MRPNKQTTSDFTTRTSLSSTIHRPHRRVALSSIASPDLPPGSSKKHEKPACFRRRIFFPPRLATRMTRLRLLPREVTMSGGWQTLRWDWHSPADWDGQRVGFGQDDNRTQRCRRQTSNPRIFEMPTVTRSLCIVHYYYYYYTTTVRAIPRRRRYTCFLRSDRHDSCSSAAQPSTFSLHSTQVRNTLLQSLC